MKLAIVILNWNGIELLKKFLKPLVTYNNENEIFVIDNNSSDDSINYIKLEWDRTIKKVFEASGNIQ